jgi:hypothetical protein
VGDVQTGDAAVQLGDKGAYEILESRLYKLAAKHLSNGVQDAHFEVKSTVTGLINSNILQQLE